ncbi:MAG: thioredoxin family protein [Deltaproteobacteria bacterium]|nr:thioredoxin family protein [Deltaproteobacteria bacterium]
MNKVNVEFINTCPCCDEYGQVIRKIAEKHDGVVDVTIYYAGKDFDYIKKYGMITKGTMIVNGKKKYENLTPDIIAKAIADAVNA